MIISGRNCCKKMLAHSCWLLGTCWQALLPGWFPSQAPRRSGESGSCLLVKLSQVGLYSLPTFVPHAGCGIEQALGAHYGKDRDGPSGVWAGGIYQEPEPPRPPSVLSIGALAGKQQGSGHCGPHFQPLCPPSPRDRQSLHLGLLVIGFL